MQTIKPILVACLCMVMVGCVKDKPNTTSYQIPNSMHHGIVISNEGSYGNNNAEISFLDIDQHQMYNQLFEVANAKHLGDIVQHITTIHNLYYAIINNSNKVVVMNPANFKEIATISSIQSPRYITQVSEQKAYVSCLYFPRIYVIDLITQSVIKTISVDFPNTEKMMVANGYCYVTNWDTASRYLYKIDIGTDSVVSKISLNAKASHDMIQDRNGMIWILSGNKFKNTSSFLTQFNPANDQIIQTLAFDQDADPIRLSINSTKDTLYYINVNYNGSASNNGLYKMGISQHDLPSLPFIKANTNSYFWAVGVDSSSQHIFLSDPKGFTQQSTVFEYSSNGTLLHQYMAGIGANHFLFK